MADATTPGFANPPAPNGHSPAPVLEFPPIKSVQAAVKAGLAMPAPARAAFLRRHGMAQHWCLLTTAEMHAMRQAMEQLASEVERLQEKVRDLQAGPETQGTQEPDGPAAPDTAP